MKSLALRCFALSLATLALTSCGRNRITLIQTSYLVTHPAAHKGDLLVFVLPETGVSEATKNEASYVHFVPGESPCGVDELSALPGKPLQCRVTVNPSVLTHYLYYIDNDEHPSSRKGCAPWCTQIIVGPVPMPKHGGKVAGRVGSGSYPAVEVPIFSDNYAGPYASDASAYGGQPVTWFTTGQNEKSWTISFAEDICQKENKITSKVDTVAYCVVKADSAVGYHSYTITVEGKTGPPSRLYVIPTSESEQTK